MRNMTKLLVVGLALGLGFSCSKDDSDEAAPGSEAVSAAPANTVTSKSGLQARLTSFETSSAEYKGDLGLDSSSLRSHGGAIGNLRASSFLMEEAEEEEVEFETGGNCLPVLQGLLGSYDELSSAIYGQDGSNGMNLKEEFESLNEELELEEGELEEGYSVENVNKGAQYAFYKRISYTNELLGTGSFEFGMGSTDTTLLASQSMTMTPDANTLFSFGTNMLLDTSAKSIIMDLAINTKSEEETNVANMNFKVTGGESPSFYVLFSGSGSDASGSNAGRSEINFGKVSANKYSLTYSLSGHENGQAMNESYTGTMTYNGTTCTFD